MNAKELCFDDCSGHVRQCEADVQPPPGWNRVYLEAGTLW